MPILPIQPGNSSSRLRQRPIIDNDIVSDCKPFLPASLRGKNFSCLFHCFGVPREQPLHLGVWIAVDDEHSVHKAE